MSRFDDIYPPRTVVGTEGNDRLIGVKNNDTLVGLGGDDYLSGGLGDDTLDGGDGDDTIYGYRGADTLTGGAGSDTFLFTHPMESWVNGARDTITDLSAEDFIKFDGYLWRVTASDVTVTDAGDLDPTTWTVFVDMPNDDSNQGINFLTMQIDVVGVMPTEANFIFA